MVFIHETVKSGVKIEKNRRFCFFFSLKTNFCDLKLKLPLQPFIDTQETRGSIEVVNPTTNEDAMVKLDIGLKIDKTFTCYVYFNFS